MKKTRLSCPVCHKVLDLNADDYECVQVTGLSCQEVDVKSISGKSEGIVYFVHRNHFNDLVQMVRVGAYPDREHSG
jgi:hypothetical protein